MAEDESWTQLISTAEPMKVFYIEFDETDENFKIVSGSSIDSASESNEF